jgi:Pyridoxamine 5'-phosphate oxidase
VSDQVPITALDTRYSEDQAEAMPWPRALILLERAELFWVSSVRFDGRPHVTPVVAAWMDGALYFSSGPEEQKSRNLASNPHCAVTTGCNTWNEGVDIVLHGEVEIVRDLYLLQRVADAFLAKSERLGLRGRRRRHLQRTRGCARVPAEPHAGTGLRQGQPIQPHALGLLSTLIFGNCSHVRATGSAVIGLLTDTPDHQ